MRTTLGRADCSTSRGRNVDTWHAGRGDLSSRVRCIGRLTVSSFRHEPHTVGVLADWRGAGRRAGASQRRRWLSFFAAKGVVARALSTRCGSTWAASRGERAVPAPRSGRSRPSGGRARVGWLGELHPGIAAEWEIPTAAAAFEIGPRRCDRGRPRLRSATRDLHVVPRGVRQDLAVVVPQSVASAEVVAAVRGAGGPLLAAVEVFDVYRGAQIGDDEVSLALRLAFRSPERTLTARGCRAPRRDRGCARGGASLGGENPSYPIDPPPLT